MLLLLLLLMMMADAVQRDASPMASQSTGM